MYYLDLFRQSPPQNSLNFKVAFFLLLEFSGLYCQKCLEKKTECTDGETGKTYAVEDVWKVSGKCLQKVCKKEEDGVSIRTEGLVLVYSIDKGATKTNQSKL